MNVKKLIKMEFKRVFHSKMFYLSLGIGLLITTLQWIEVGLPMAVNIVDGYIPSEVSTPYSAFESFFGLAGPPLVYRQIYYTIAPILAVMAHAVTLCGDKASGYVKNLYIRSKRQDYYTAKYIVSGIAGGIAVTAPIAANFLWNLMMLPAIEPMASMAIYPYGIGLWSDVLYTNPYLFILLYILLIFFLSVYICECSIDFVKTGDKQIFGCDTSVFIKLFFSHAGSQYTKVSSESDCDI